MTDFDRELSALLARYAVKHSEDQSALAEMVEVMSRGLGATIAIVADGHPETIDSMVIEAEGIAHENAVAKAAMARVLASARVRREATLDRIIGGRA